MILQLIAGGIAAYIAGKLLFGKDDKKSNSSSSYSTSSYATRYPSYESPARCTPRLESSTYNYSAPSRSTYPNAYTTSTYSTGTTPNRRPLQPPSSSTYQTPTYAHLGTASNSNGYAAQTSQQLVKSQIVARTANVNQRTNASSNRTTATTGRNKVINKNFLEFYHPSKAMVNLFNCKFQNVIGLSYNEQLLLKLL